MMAVAKATEKQEQCPPLPVKGQKYYRYVENWRHKELHPNHNINGERQQTPAATLVVEEALGTHQSPAAALLVEEALKTLDCEDMETPLNAEQSAACSKPSQQPKPSNGVPVIVESCLQYFNTYATDCVCIFRVPGSSQRVSKMMEHIEQHPFAWTSINCVNVFMRNHPEFTVHDVSSFLKRFINSIVGNEPVIAYDCHEPLMDLIRSKCPSNLIGKKCRRVLGQLLVPARRLLLARLCTFLHEFSKHEARTKMNCASLAVCFANLIYPPPGDNEDPNKKNTKNHKKFRRSKSAVTVPAFKKIKRVKRAQSAAACCALMKAEAEKTKLCVAVIRILIEQSHIVFRTQRVPAVTQ